MSPVEKCGPGSSPSIVARAQMRLSSQALEASETAMARLKFINSLVFVSDMERALGLYRDLLGQKVAQNHGDFVQLENGLALHSGPALETTMFGSRSPDTKPYGRGNLVLYFEVEDIAEAFARIAPAVGLIHPVQTQAWGQKVFRFYDPDGHIVEVGEPL